MIRDETASLVHRLKAEDDVRRLVFRYAELCDEGYNALALAELFTKDARWAAASVDGELDFGAYHGREEIQEFFASLTPTIGPRTFHGVMAPVIELNERLDAGVGHWRALTVIERRSSEAGETEVALLAATYDHEYQRVSGRWLISRLTSVIIFQHVLGRTSRSRATPLDKEEEEA